LEETSECEISNLISSFKSNESSGPYGISCGLLKENVHLLSTPLCYIFNLSLTTSVVPDKFKIAKVVPVYKKGSTTLTSNYRPISLLSIFNKLLEKVVYSRLFNFLNKNHALYKFQFGFRKHHSTSLSLLDVMDMCYKNIDKNNKAIGIFLDLQKAFDTVDHKVLLCKLQYYGICGLLFNWLKHYLSNRKQYTVVNGVSSSINDISCGVPQGSVLGPLLFLIYMNDISYAVPDHDLKLFADDTNVFIFGPDLTVLEYKANLCLANLELWFRANKLSINIDKTCYTLFSSTKKNSAAISLNLLINGQRISKVASCKYLGVIIDEALAWNEHIDYLYKKLLKFTSLFYKLRSFVPKNCLYKLYYAFVFPHINYGAEVYANCTKSSIDKLNTLNNKILRILLHTNYETPNIDLYRTFNVLPISLLHEMKLLELIQKYYYHKYLLPDIFQHYFITNISIHQHHTRNVQNLHLPTVNSNAGQRSSLNPASKFWNTFQNFLKAI